METIMKYEKFCFWNVAAPRKISVKSGGARWGGATPGHVFSVQ